MKLRTLLYTADIQLLEFKQRLEKKIIDQGKKGKTAIIRSSSLINLIHDAVKNELIRTGINPHQIHPKLGKSSRELEIAGFLKRKRQDVCVTPDSKKIPEAEREIDWGPLAYKKLKDKFGQTYAENTLVINVRSQLSSLAKNSDTLFERTFAEAENLHMQYPKMILGDVYLIPVYEYNEAAMDNADHTKRIAFKPQHTDVARYISIF